MPGAAARHLILTRMPVFVAALALCLLAGMPAFAQQFPALTGRVVDAANVIPADQEARLGEKLAALEAGTQRQLVVVTLPDLQGYDIADYGYRLGRHWGIGDKERNDGALLIVAPKERKVRIEVGYGLEGILTDGLSSLIINQSIVPRFKAGDMPGGIEAGVDALVAQLALPEDQARIAAQRASEVPEPQFPPEMIFLAFMFLFFFIIPFFRTMHQRRRFPAAAGSVFVWDMMRNMPRGGGSSGGFGGGGFSGGGGSFGGGGASGSW